MDRKTKAFLALRSKEAKIRPILTTIEVHEGKAYVTDAAVMARCNTTLPEGRYNEQFEDCTAQFKRDLFYYKVFPQYDGEHCVIDLSILKKLKKKELKDVKVVFKDKAFSSLYLYKIAELVGFCGHEAELFKHLILIKEGNTEVILMEVVSDDDVIKKVKHCAKPDEIYYYDKNLGFIVL